MRTLFLAIELALQLLLPAAAGEPGQKPFLAIYTMPDQQDVWPVEKFHPDLYFESTDYADFPVFLEVVKKQAGDRPIDLDLEMHGDDTGLALYKSGNTPHTVCSMGYLFKQIDQHLDPRHVTVLIESCYSGRALHYTLTANSVWDGPFYQDYDGVPQYPVYGIGARTVNCGNLIYCQYRTGKRVWFEDIRHWSEDPLPSKVEDYKNDPITVWLFMLWVATWEMVQN